MMKRIVVFSAAILAAISAFAQSANEIDWPDYKFTTVKENRITPVKNQFRSGTCWAFSATGFVESEIIRINNITDPAKYPDLSEFFTISHSYLERAEKFVRVDGALGFSAGSEGDDVLDVIREWGIVPQAEMTGMNYGTQLPVQAELDAVLRAYVDVIVKNPNRTLTTAWKNGLKGILDAYLGPWPEKFTVDGKEFTPQSYRDYLKFNPDDYVSLTSFTHHPFYTSFALEIPDNWRWNKSYNLPIDEFMNIIDSAINAGYTLEWGTDVSEPGFTRNGYAVLVDVEATNTTGSDQEHWVGKDESEKPAVKEIVEKDPTQEQRQIEFDNKTMTDDHGMQIYGIARDQFGKKYYMVKNSWGTTSQFQGIWYASEPFVKAQTISVTVHKNALPKELRTKLGIR